MISVSSIFLYLVTITGALSLVWCVSEFKRPIGEIIAIAIAEGVVCFAAVVLAYIYIKTDFIFYFAIGTISAITIISATFFISKDKWYVILYEALSQANGFLISMYVGKSFAHLVTNVSLQPWIEVIARAACFTVMVLEYKFYLKKAFRELANNYQGKVIWIALSVISVLFSALFLSIIFFPRPLAERGPAIPMFNTTMVMAIFAYTAVFTFSMVSFKSILENETIKRTLHEDQLKTEYWKSKIEAQNELIHNVRKTKHDLRHHDNYLADLLNKKEYDKALEYLERHGATIDQMSFKEYCKNDMVNSILTSYITKAENAGIKVECKANVPAEIAIDNLELASLYANLLENATEACNRLDKDQDKFINISTVFQDDSLRIQVENSCVKNLEFKGEFPVSTKDIPSGIGTKSIADIATKHNGVFEFSENEGVFTARIVLEVI